MRRQSGQLLRVRSRDEDGRQLGAGKRRPMAADWTFRRKGWHRLRGKRRWRLPAGTADLRPGDDRRETESSDQGPRAERLVRALGRVLDAQARPRFQRVLTDL